MSAKRINFLEERGKRLKRETMTLAMKIEVLDKLRDGHSASSLGWEYKVNESTIRTIRNNEESIRESASAAGVACDTIKRMTRRSIQLTKTENFLSSWIKDMMSEGVTLSGDDIREKAEDIYREVCEKDGEPSTAVIFSNGWFYSFRKRYNMTNMKFSRRTVQSIQQSTNDNRRERAVRKEAEKYDLNLEQVFKFEPYFPSESAEIEESNYTPHQVFNADETVLFWKSLSARTPVLQKEQSPVDSNASDDRVSILLCANASGDFRCQPMLVYNSESPSLLRGKKKSLLPVYWKSNPKAMITSSLFLEWFTFSFIPQVSNYLKKQNLPFKVLLILDDAAHHPTDILQCANNNVRVIFIPPKAAAVLQPLQQDVIKIFKCNYIKCVLRRIHENQGSGMAEFWHSFNITHAITDVRAAWDSLDESTLNVCWCQLWPSAVKKFTKSTTVDEEIKEVVHMAKCLGGESFSELKEEDVKDFLSSEEMGEKLNGGLQHPATEVSGQGKSQLNESFQPPAIEVPVEKEEGESQLHGSFQSTVEKEPREPNSNENVEHPAVEVADGKVQEESQLNKAFQPPIIEVSGVENQSETQFTEELIFQSLQGIENIVSNLVITDPDRDRSHTFKQVIELATLPYRELYNNMVAYRRQCISSTLIETEQSNTYQPMKAPSEQSTTDWSELISVKTLTL